MNKYREALSYFVEHCYEVDYDYDWEESTIVSYSPTLDEEHYDALNELIEKETMKDVDTRWGVIVCPVCRCKYIGNYCQNCGQKLDFKNVNWEKLKK